MKKMYTRSGKPITQEMIDAIGAEAEAGFPGATFTPVHIGRPRIGDSESQQVQFRLDMETFKKLREEAEQTGTTVSALVREYTKRELENRRKRRAS